VLRALSLTLRAPSPIPSPIPQLSGRSGEQVTELYAAGQKAKNFDKIVKDLEGFVGVVRGAGMVIDRFFTTSNYSEGECKKVLGLLLTSAEPLTSFKDIKDEETREVIVAGEGNVAGWLAARKAVAALGLSAEVKAALDTMAAEAALNRVSVVSRKASELRNAVSKTVDVTVSSAVTLTKAQQDAVRAALPAYAPQGVNVNVAFAIDSAVLGGLRVDMASQTIDLSATTRLVEVLAARGQ
jgi:hypothetical protein